MVKHRSDMAKALARPTAGTASTVLTIDSRQELLNALQQAVQVEHGLMLQYLYAALSCKRSSAEGISEGQVELIRGWERRLLQVARDEMGHLGTVCNLVTAFGGVPDFSRPNFPQSAGGWFPFDFQLERLSLASIRRFVRFESPKPSEMIEALALIPDPIDYNFVGELYRSIKSGIQRLAVAYNDPSKLFLGRRAFEGDNDWKALPLFSVDSTEAALTAIDYIVSQGEGIAKVGPESHYSTFARILEEYQEELAKDPSFDPARQLISNPATLKHKDVTGATLIENDVTREAAGLFNHVYMTMLMLLAQFFDPAGETGKQRIAIQAAARRTMSAAVRPLAEILTLMPATKNPAGPFAGAPFEIYGDLGLPAFLNARFRILLERVAESADAARELAEASSLTRLEFVAKNLDYLKKNLEETFGVTDDED